MRETQKYAISKKSKWTDTYSGSICTYSQCADQILNKIANTFDETYAGLKSTLQGFRIYIFRNPSSKGMESTSQAAQPIRPYLT